MLFQTPLCKKQDNVCHPAALHRSQLKGGGRGNSALIAPPPPHFQGNPGQPGSILGIPVSLYILDRAGI